MNLWLPVILLLIGGMLFLIAVRSLRAGRLKERYAVLFGLLGVPFIALAAWPDAVGYLAMKMGIQYTTVLLLVVTTFFLLMNFKLLSIISVQDRKITTLAQNLAILLSEQERAGEPEISGGRGPGDSE